MRNILRNQRSVLLLLAICILFLVSGCGSKTVKSYPDVLDGIDRYFKAEGDLKKNEDITLASWYRPGDSLTDWIIISEIRQGKKLDNEKYISDITAYISESYKDPDRLDRIKATEWHRITMAVLLAEGDPRKMASQNSDLIDLFADGVYNWDQTASLDTQGANALIYALNVIRAGDYTIPPDSRYQEKDIVSRLLEYQGENGAFGLTGNGEDVDITAMAVQALAPYASKYGGVNEAVESAIDFLSGAQRAGGYYAFGNHYSSETCSQVIMALAAAGIDPGKDERFIKSGVSVADALMSFRNKDEGFASRLGKNGKPEESDMLATRQAACAITSMLLLDKGNGDYLDYSNTLQE